MLHFQNYFICKKIKSVDKIIVSTDDFAFAIVEMISDTEWRLVAAATNPPDRLAWTMFEALSCVVPDSHCCPGAQNTESWVPRPVTSAEKTRVFTWSLHALYGFSLWWILNDLYELDSSFDVIVYFLNIWNKLLGSMRNIL